MSILIPILVFDLISANCAGRILLLNTPLRRMRRHMKLDLGRFNVRSVVNPF